MPRINISLDDISFCVLCSIAKSEGFKPGTYCKSILIKSIPKFEEIILEKKFVQQHLFNTNKKKR